MNKFKNLQFGPLEQTGKIVGFVEYNNIENAFISICTIEPCGSYFELECEVLGYCEHFDDIEETKEIANQLFHEIISNCLNIT